MFAVINYSSVQKYSQVWILLEELLHPNIKGEGSTLLLRVSRFSYESDSVDRQKVSTTTFTARRPPVFATCLPSDTPHIIRLSLIARVSASCAFSCLARPSCLRTVLAYVALAVQQKIPPA